MGKYNVVVVGGGSAGLMVAAGAVGLGARVALVEARKMGGDCLNYGCIPSKALIANAKEVWLAGKGGKGAGGGADFSWEAITGRVQAVIDGIAPHDSVERFTSLGVEVFQGRGSLLSPHGVEVVLPEGGREQLEANSVVLATGSSPSVPPIPGLEEAGYQTNESIFTMAGRPERLLVMGGGPIGCELAQCFTRLGTRVTLIEFLPTILNREDEEAAELVTEALRREGVEIITGERVVRVEKSGAEKIVYYSPGAEGDGGEQAVTVDEILVAAGRKANLEGLGLDKAGVRLEGGRVAVNNRMQSSVGSIYACGDIAGPYLFTHTANQQARVVIQNALFPVKARMDYRVVPWCTFTEPELARVGLNGREAREKGIPFREVRIPFSGIDRALCDGETEGFLKILTPPGKDDILGATLVGAHGGDMIHEIVLAMQARIGLKKIAEMIHIYPTRAEIFRRAADESRKEGFTPLIQRFFKAYLSWRQR